MSEYFKIFIVVLYLSAFIYMIYIYESALALRKDKMLNMHKELVKEKEQLRLLRKLNPEPKHGDYEFFYDESTKFVERIQKGSEWRMNICKIETPAPLGDFGHKFGYRIAKLLNDGYITASPEPENNMEVVFKEEYKRFSPSLQREIAELELKGKEIIEFGNSISKVPTIKADTPMPPVKPPKKE